MLERRDEVLLDSRPHWFAMRRPATLALVVLGGVVAGFLAWAAAPVWFGAVLAAALLVAAARVGAAALSWRSTRLVVTTTRVAYRSGVLRRSGREIPLASVQDVSYHQGLLERILRTGSLVVESAAERGRTDFPDIAGVRAVVVLVNDAVIAARAPVAPRPQASEAGAIPEQIGRLGELYRRGVLTAEEFQQKKGELLDRM